MNWFFIALGAPFLWALVNISDNYLVTRFKEEGKERSSGGLVLFSSLSGIVTAFLVWIFTDHLFEISRQDKILLLFSGVLTIAWVILYLFTLETEETSSVVPWFLTVPVFGYILGYVFLGETLTREQLLGSGIIFLGLILINLNWSGEKRKFKPKPAVYMLIACAMSATIGVLFKYVTVENNFWVASFWQYVGLGISGLFIFLFVPSYRASFIHMNKTGGGTIFALNTFSESITIVGNLLTNFALTLAPVAMVYLVASFQPAIVLFLSILGTKFLPHIVKENISRQVLVPKIVAIAIMVFGSVLLFW
jgi:uncharacterized membrane protein